MELSTRSGAAQDACPGDLFAKTEVASKINFYSICTTL